MVPGQGMYKSDRRTDRHDNSGAGAGWFLDRVCTSLIDGQTDMITVDQARGGSWTGYV